VPRATIEAIKVSDEWDGHDASRSTSPAYPLHELTQEAALSECMPLQQGADIVERRILDPTACAEAVLTGA